MLSGRLTTIEGDVRPKGLEFTVLEDFIRMKTNETYFLTSTLVNVSDIEKICLIQATLEGSYFRYDVWLDSENKIEEYKEKITAIFKKIVLDMERNIQEYKQFLNMN